MAETGVLLDGNGIPVVPALVWSDTRGETEANRIIAELGSDTFATRTGLPPTRLCSLSKYLWLRAHFPEAAGGVRWLSVAEWVVYGLGGEMVAELSLASRTGFLDLAARTWWDEALTLSDAPSGLLPTPVVAGTPAGRVRGSSLAEAEGALLTVAGHDHPCVAVGVGAFRPGDLLDSCGTAEAVIRAVRPEVGVEQIRQLVAEGLTLGWHAVPGWLAIQGAFESGSVLARYLELLSADESSIPDLDRGALEVSAAPDGLVVLGATAELSAISPSGRRAPPAIVWRAALEAIERRAATLIAGVGKIAGPAERLVVTGGWARHAGVKAVKAQMLGSFDQPAVVEAGARGAAMLAACAAGVYASVDELPRPTYEQHALQRAQSAELG
jgi:sugar (pentulose or hexulose) kinase